MHSLFTDEFVLVALLQLHSGFGVGDDVVGEDVLRRAAVVRFVGLVGSHVGVKPVWQGKRHGTMMMMVVVIVTVVVNDDDDAAREKIKGDCKKNAGGAGETARNETTNSEQIETYTTHNLASCQQ